MRRNFLHIVFIVFGDALAGFGVACFLNPSNITAGGLTGVATIIAHILPIPIGIVIFALNLPLVIIGYLKLGKEVIIKTFVSLLAYSFFVDFFGAVVPYFSLDVTITTLCGSVILGVGMGIILLFGATSGGTDIAVKLLQIKFPYISMGRMLLVLDGLVVLASFAVFGSLEMSLYAVAGIFVTTAVMDKILLGGVGGKLALIITDDEKEIKSAIYKALSRGVSEVKITGGYTGTDKTMLICALRRQQIGAFYTILHSVNNKCFVIMCDVGEILGNGF